jgi:hypothetical protein
MARRWDPRSLHLGWRAFLATVLVALAVPSAGVAMLTSANDLAAPDYSRSAPLSGAVVATEQLTPRTIAPQGYSQPAVAGVTTNALLSSADSSRVRAAGFPRAQTRDTAVSCARAPPSTKA